MEQFEQDMIEIDLREYFNIIWYRKWFIIGAMIVALLASYFISINMTKIYQSSTLVMVKEDNGMENLFSDQLSLGMGKNDKVGTYTEILKSRRILNKVIEKLDLRSIETGELISTKELREVVSIAGGENNLITITVNYSDAEMAKRIANTLIEEFREENREMNSVELKGAESFISTQLENTERRLAELENQLLSYKEKHGVILPSEQGKVTLERLTEVETAKAKAEVELKESRVSLTDVNKKLAEEDKEIISTKVITDNPIVKNYQQQLANLEVELAGLRESYTDKHPKVLELLKQKEEIKARLEEAVTEVVSSRTKTINPLYSSLRNKMISLQTNIIATESQLQTYQVQIQEIKEELSALPEKELALARLQRESKVTESIYTMLRQKKEETQIQEAMKTSDITVVDPAVASEFPIKPNVKLNMVIAMMLAIFMAVGVIFLIEYLDTTIKDESDVERLTGLPVLGMTPHLDMIDHSQGYGRGE
jgi:polysaccharide chain length determinant protein (PEP-CTERM system associated)